MALEHHSIILLNELGHSVTEAGVLLEHTADGLDESADPVVRELVDVVRLAGRFLKRAGLTAVDLTNVESRAAERGWKTLPKQKKPKKAYSPAPQAARDQRQELVLTFILQADEADWKETVDYARSVGFGGNSAASLLAGLVEYIDDAKTKVRVTSAGIQRLAEIEARKAFNAA